jgi:hypothetical protein
MLDKTSKTKAPTTVIISPPNFELAKIKIVGDSPFVSNKMTSENRKKMMDKQESGERSKKGAKRPPKDFDAIYRGSMHVSTDGWYGIPAPAFRAGLVSACRLVGFQMVRAKLCLFVEKDGIDADDGSPLVRIYGKPERRVLPVKLADGSTDIISRGFFFPWSASLTLKWDADQFSASDVLALLARVGQQVGVGAGRNDSKNSCGMGWGVFHVEN